MAAAVGDFRPAQVATQKIKKGGDGLDAIELARNPDILVAVKKQRQQSGKPDVVVGFAACVGCWLWGGDEPRHNVERD